MYSLRGIEKKVLGIISSSVANIYRVIPLEEIDAETVRVCTDYSNKGNLKCTRDDLSFMLDKKVVIASPLLCKDKMDKALSKYYPYKVR